MITTTPPLSIVIANPHPEPALAGHLLELTRQAREMGAEVIVAQGHDESAIADAFPDVTCIRRSGASAVQLSAFGILRARGDVVATTEDHCRVGSGWCQAIVAAHRAAPEALVIGGAVDNSAPGLPSWGHFLLTNGELMPPLASGPLAVLPSRANASYKRSALPREFPEHGFVEMFFIRELLAQGKSLRQNSEMTTIHDQPLDLRTSLRYHYHNGRTIAGARLGWISAFERAARLAACVVLPVFLASRPLGAIRRRGMAVRMIPVYPLLITMGCAHAVGEVTGYLFGLGNSPRVLH